MTNKLSNLPKDALAMKKPTNEDPKNQANNSKNNLNRTTKTSCAVPSQSTTMPQELVMEPAYEILFGRTPCYRLEKPG